MTARCTVCGRHWIVSIRAQLTRYECPYCASRARRIREYQQAERNSRKWEQADRAAWMWDKCR